MRTLVAAFILAGSMAIALPQAATPEATMDTPTVDQQRSAVAVQQVPLPLPGLRDEAAMVLVGTALIGLGAAVRRAA